MKFNELAFKEKTQGWLGIQAVVEFENGFGASVIQGPYSYGGPEGRYELAVLHHGKLCYDSGIVNDVIGWLSEDEVSEYLDLIEHLPKRD